MSVARIIRACVVSFTPVTEVQHSECEAVVSSTYIDELVVFDHGVAPPDNTMMRGLRIVKLRFTETSWDRDPALCQVAQQFF